MRAALHTTAPAAIARAAQMFARPRFNAQDTSEALEWMFVHGELSEELSERINEVAQEFCEKREERSTPTPNGKFVAIANDACALLLDLQRRIDALDFFGGDTGLVELQRTAQRIVPILAQMGYRRPQ